MSIQALALILLIGHLISVAFIFTVLRKQYALLKLPIDKHLRTFRRVLFILSAAIFLGNFIPIAIDALTLFVDTGRPPSVRVVSIMYAVSNMVVAVTSSILVWLLYRIAASDDYIDATVANHKSD
jgi:hypothetical protein